MIPTTRFSRNLGWILLLDAALLLPVLGRSMLSRIDEAQIAEVSREMVTGRDWVTPRIGAIPFAAYPPFHYWLLAASGSIFGFTEFAMRLPTALASLALLAVLAVLTRRLAGDDAGIAAALILATTPAFFLQSTVCRADVLTMLFATAAFDRFLAWTEPAERGGRKNRDLALMYLFTALGILTKGPLTVAVLGLGGLAWFLVRREWTLLIGMKFWYGIPAALLIVIPWYYAVYHLNGWAFVRENLLLENVNAYTEGYQQKRPWTFYLRQTPLLTPWLFSLTLTRTVRRAPGVALSLVWAGLVFLFLELSSAKRINYLTYLTAPLAMAAATMLTALWRDKPALARRCLLGFGCAVAAGGAVLALIPASVWTGASLLKIATRIPWIGGVSAGAALGVVLMTARFGFCAGFAGMTGALATAFFVYGAFVNPRLNLDTREMAEGCRRLATRIPAGETLYVPAEGGAEGFYHFYVGRTLPSREGEPGLYLASELQERKFRKDGKPLEIIDRMLDHQGRDRYLLRIIP
ncbi:MAG TPA: glycosyltransferase family 39 protein [Planctomycetota bacterium]|nr:glycosyltransferase family 39 protein [Planctomycetota bacterium]